MLVFRVNLKIFICTLDPIPLSVRINYEYFKIKTTHTLKIFKFHFNNCTE